MSKLEQVSPVTKAGLAVKGFSDRVDEEFLDLYFGRFGDIQHIHFLGDQKLAYVEYTDPSVALPVATQKHTIFGEELTVEVGYSLPTPQEECALIVKGLPPIPALNPALEYYFIQQGHEVVFCEIVDQVAYLKFNEPTVVQKIVSQPPTQEFLAGVKLQMESIPVSEIPVSEIPISEIPVPEVPAAMKQQSGGIDITKIHGQYQQQQAAVHGPIPPLGHPSGQHPPSPYGSPPDRGMQYPSTWASPGGQPTPVPHPQPGMWTTPVSKAYRAPSPVPGQQNQETSGLHPNPLGDKQFFVEDLDSPYPQRYPSSQQPQQPPPLILAGGVIPNQVIVEGFPQDTQEFVLQLYLGSLCQTNQCTEVKMYGNAAVATFSAPVDFNSLVQKSRMSPFPRGKIILSFSPMKPPDTVVVSNLPENIPEFVLELYFNCCAPVERVKLVPPNQALVTFKNHQSVQPILSQQHALGTTPITVQEYHPLSGPSTGDQVNELSNPQPQLNISSPQAKHMWVPLKRKISPEKQHYLFNTLSKLNTELKGAKAHASIEEDRSDGASMIIKPEQGASELTDWEDKVGRILSDHLASFKDSKSTVPAEAKGEVLEYTMNLRNDHPELYVKPEGDTLVLAGSKVLVDEVLERVSEICETFRVVNTSFTLPRKHIQYLMQFCKRDLDTLVGVEYTADSENEVIEVRANPKNVKVFQDLIGEKIRSIQEKSMMLSVDAHGMWIPLKRMIAPEKQHYLLNTLNKLNTELKDAKAHASIKVERSDSASMIIKPEQGASEFTDWEERVSRILSDHLASFKGSKFTFPTEAKEEVLEYTINLRDKYPELFVKTEGDTLVLAGSQELVSRVLERVSEICEPFRVVSASFTLPRKHIKYLMQFCKRDLDTVKGVQYTADSEKQVIEVRANPRNTKAFQALISEKIRLIKEKSMILSVDAHVLLSSSRGKERIATTIGTFISSLIYDFEVTSTGAHQLCFLSASEELCQGAVDTLSPCIQQKVIPVSQTKARVCNTPQWKQLEKKFTKECFVQISVMTESIVITGQSVTVAGVAAKMSQFIQEQTSVRDHIVCQRSEWRVIRENKFKELTAVKDRANKMNVDIDFPESKVDTDTVKILIWGDHTAVYDVKVRIEMLRSSLIKKVVKVSRVPGLLQILKSLEDKLRVLEQTHKVVIEVDIESEDNGTTETAKSVQTSTKLCTATTPDGRIVTVFTGDFTQNRAGTLVNFVTPDRNYSQGNLMALVNAGGGEVQDDLHSKMSQVFDLRPGLTFRSNHGQLKCTQLLHCVIPPWEGGDKNEGFFLEEAFQNFIGSCTAPLITPVTAQPFGYPVDVFAKKVADIVNFSYDAQVTVFVESVSHAKAFEESLKAKNFQICSSLSQRGSSLSAAMPQTGKPDVTTARGHISAKAISGQINTFIFLSQGDMFQQEADICLQELCKEYAPLGPGAIAVTTANNLKCKYIFHISLPSHSSVGSERVFRETVQNALKAAQIQRASTIVIPSLGVAGLGYPASISAKILFEEVITFHICNPSSIQKFYFVIYDKSVHQEFSKVYAQCISQSLASGQDISQATHSFSSARTVTPAHVRSSSGDQVSSSQQSTRLYVVQENIVNESTDAIVNTTTKEMNLSTGGVSKAISRKAGPKLQMVCKQLVDNGLKLEQGKIAVTSACGQLRCKKVIHAHLPHGPAASHTFISPQQMVEKIVTACVEKAEEECLRSISFPAFGTGAAGYSVASMAEPMLKALKRFSQTKPKSVETIRIVILDQKLHQEFFEFFCTFFNIDITSQGSQGIFHSIGASLKASPDFRGKDDIYVELQPGGSKHPGALSVCVPGSQVAVDISPHALPNPVAVFKIYAASMNTADKIELEIRKNVKERVADEKIEEKYIGYLIDDDIQEIESIGNDQGVVIKVMPKIKQITISGEQRRVGLVQMKVTNLLREIKKAHTELQIFEWQSQDGEMFESYPPEANVRLERAYKKGIPAIQMTIDDVEVVIDLKNFQEMSRATGSTRTVKRVRKMQIEKSLHLGVYSDYPMTWEEQPKEGGRAKISHMFDVPVSSLEYQDAIKEFAATIQSTKCTIVKVQRIQNHTEYAKHCSFRDTLQHKHGKKAEERRLFHGTKTDSVDAIAYQGFNRIFASDANAAAFGKGVYFAVNASYSAKRQYAVPDSSGQQRIFVCNVVIGAYTKGSREMKIAPRLPNNPHVLFDSLANDEKNPTIFVAMSDSQAYPEYLVTFKLN